MNSPLFGVKFFRCSNEIRKYSNANDNFQINEIVELKNRNKWVLGKIIGKEEGRYIVRVESGYRYGKIFRRYPNELREYDDIPNEMKHQISDLLEEASSSEPKSILKEGSPPPFQNVYKPQTSYNDPNLDDEDYAPDNKRVKKFCLTELSVLILILKEISIEKLEMFLEPNNELIDILKIFTKSILKDIGGPHLSTVVNNRQQLQKASTTTTKRLYADKRSTTATKKVCTPTNDRQQQQRKVCTPTNDRQQQQEGAVDKSSTIKKNVSVKFCHSDKMNKLDLQRILDAQQEKFEEMLARVLKKQAGNGQEEIETSIYSKLSSLMSEFSVDIPRDIT
uniref:SH3 domain-containing protein n=1 Tax=Meloidogyne javanica TaxID=6303 RepID=A0A915LR77_MELJA